MTDLRITQLDSRPDGGHRARALARCRWPPASGSASAPATSRPSSVGVSHFLEHLLFKGTADALGAARSRAPIDRVGGDINAFTTKEYTAYYCRLPARHAALGVELLGDVLTRPALRDADVESERQVILEELAMDDDSPDDVAHRAFVEQLFPDHPLGRDTGGRAPTRCRRSPPTTSAGSSPSTTAPASMVVVRRRSARPRRGARRWSTTAFADVAPGDGRTARAHRRRRSAAIEPSTTTPSRCTSSSAAGRCARGDADREALDVVNHVLGGGLSSRLFEEIRERRGLAYSVYSGVVRVQPTAGAFQRVRRHAAGARRRGASS